MFLFSFLMISRCAAGSSKGLIIGAAVGGSALVLLLALLGVYALHQKRQANEPWSRSMPLVRCCPSITQKAVEKKL